nr:MAG TPA_asm: hypothetical protein [Caudoviricetes sp.]
MGINNLLIRSQKTTKPTIASAFFITKIIFNNKYIRKQLFFLY